MILSAVLSFHISYIFLEISPSFSWRRRRTCFATGIRNIGVSPRVNICPNGAVPWHIPPDICSVNLSGDSRSSGLSHWINKSGSFQSFHLVSSARFPGQETLGALPSNTIHIYIFHNRLFGSVVILGGLIFVNFPLCIHLC